MFDIKLNVVYTELKTSVRSYVIFIHLISFWQTLIENTLVWHFVLIYELLMLFLIKTLSLSYVTPETLWQLWPLGVHNTKTNHADMIKTLNLFHIEYNFKSHWPAKVENN